MIKYKEKMCFSEIYKKKISRVLEHDKRFFFWKISTNIMLKTTHKTKTLKISRQNHLVARFIVL